MNTYFERNRLWLSPALIGFMIATAPIIMQVLSRPGTSSVPTWLPLLAGIIAAFGAGIGAMLTDTTSARIVRFVGLAFGFAIVLHAIFK